MTKNNVNLTETGEKEHDNENHKRGDHKIKTPPINKPVLDHMWTRRTLEYRPGKTKSDPSDLSDLSQDPKASNLTNQQATKNPAQTPRPLFRQESQTPRNPQALSWESPSDPVDPKIKLKNRTKVKVPLDPKQNPELLGPLASEKDLTPYENSHKSRAGPQEYKGGHALDPIARNHPSRK